MHKKDFVTFARMIKTQRHKIAQARIEKIDASIPVFCNGADKAIDIIVDELVQIFKSDNDKFDADKFYKACTIQES